MDYSEDERMILYGILCSRSKTDELDKLIIQFHDIKGRGGSDIQNVTISKDIYKRFIDKMENNGILVSANESLRFTDDVHEGTILCDILLRAENVKERLDWLFEYLSGTVCQKYFRFIKGNREENRPCIYLPPYYCCIFLEKIIRRWISENNRGLFNLFSIASKSKY